MSDATGNDTADDTAGEVADATGADAPRPVVPKATKSKAALSGPTGKVAAQSDTAQIPVSSNPVTVVDPDDDWDDDFDEEPDRRFDAARSKRARRVTGALALVAAIGVGFAGGVIFQHHRGGSATSASGLPSNLSALASRFRSAAASGGGASAFGGFGGAGGLASGGAVSGTVTAVSGDTLYISSGTSSALTKVETSPTSTVTVPASGTVADIQPGDTVTISGAKQSNGSYMAATITDRGAATTTTGATGAAG